MPLSAPALIESERVDVRVISRDDLASLYDVNSDDVVTELLPYATWASMDDAEAWYQRMEALQKSGSAIQFVIADKTNGYAIGTCLLFRFDEPSSRAELGYALGRKHWGKGLMTEALAALLGSAFSVMRLRRVEAEVDTRNARSRALLLRLGFVKEGLLRERWLTKGELKSVELYALLQREWRSATARSSP